MDVTFLDANIIMYAVGREHPLKHPCRKVLQKIKDGDIIPVTNTEILQEIIYRYYSMKMSDIAEKVYSAMNEICETIFSISVRETDKALELLKKYKSIEPRDTVHAATMINNSIKNIISTDTHFDIIKEITRIDPRKV